MKIVLFLALSLLLSSLTFGQTKDLPSVLVPDNTAQKQAKQIGAEVLKLLPRGTYKEIGDGYNDEDNPLGIRGGGAYYSFSTLSHSYNKTPQISLESGEFNVGFYGANYGFIVDLGEVSLSETMLDREITRSLICYRPPQLYDDARREAMASHNYQAGDFVFRRRSAVKVGHTYLLRSISFDESDILVAFNVAGIDDNGAINIIWKKIVNFDKPILLYLSDSDLTEKIEDILKRKDYQDVAFSISNNEVTLSGIISREYYGSLMASVQELRPKRVINQIKMR